MLTGFYQVELMILNIAEYADHELCRVTKLGVTPRNKPSQNWNSYILLSKSGHRESVCFSVLSSSLPNIWTVHHPVQAPQLI